MQKNGVFTSALLWGCSSITGRRVVIGVVLLLGVVLFAQLVQRDLPLLYPGEYRSLQCSTGSDDHSLPLFRVLTVVDNGAQAFARRLCSSLIMRQHYSGVEVQWRPRSELSARDIVEERFDLFWNRDRRVQSLVPNFEQYYQTVARLPDYAVAWFSLQQTPQLTPEFFYARSVGLLEDMQSNSHFLMPLMHLKALGVDLTRTRIRYFPNYHALQQAFWSGEVNLISDADWLQDMAGDRVLYRTLIDSHASMGRWYARRHRDRGIDCVLVEGLRELVASLKSSGLQVTFDNVPEACL